MRSRLLLLLGLRLVFCCASVPLLALEWQRCHDPPALRHEAPSRVGGRQSRCAPLVHHELARCCCCCCRQRWTVEGSSRSRSMRATTVPAQRPNLAAKAASRKTRLEEEFPPLKAAIAKEIVSRERADDEIANAVNHYTAQLQNSIKVVGGVATTAAAAATASSAAAAVAPNS